MMALSSDWLDRVDALLQAVRDVRPAVSSATLRSTIPVSHQQLFEAYVRDMRRAIQGAHAWWDAMIQTELRRTNDRAEAEREVRRRNPVGPVADRGVIAVLRKYWLATEALNADLHQSERLAPEELTLGLLVHPPYDDVARFLSQLPYWPIGMDEDGTWI